MKIGIYCYLTADIVPKVLEKCSLNSPLPNISSFLSKPLNLIGCHRNRKVNFENKYWGSENWPLLLCHCRYSDKHFQKCSLSSPLPNISFLSKPLNLIGCHGNQKAKFEKIYLKTHLLRSHKGAKAETLQKCS